MGASSPNKQPGFRVYCSSYQNSKTNVADRRYECADWSAAVFVENVTCTLEVLRPEGLFHRLFDLYHLGLDVRKPVFGGLRTTQAQTSLRIRAV